MKDPFPHLTREISELHCWESEIIAAYLTERHAGEATVLREILSSPRYSVALYGPTKAGKTTLILKLLGVDEAAIGRILRGNEDHDKTGTPTAIIYSRSPDDDGWYVTGDDLSRERIENDDGAKSWLDHVRKRMEGLAKPPFHSGRPLKIEIPGKHFRTTTPLEKQEIELIDLPGHSGGGSEEVRHAQMLYDAIAKNAALVLHVYPASNLTSAGALTQFKSGSVILDEWWNFPDKSRLVLTRTVTAQSVRDQLEKKIEQGASDEQLREWLKNHVHIELNRSGVPLREAHLIFPLEYGASWKQCREAPTGSRYHDRMETVFSADYSEITNLILESDQPRLLFDHVSTKSTELHYKRRLDDLDQRLRNATAEVEKARRDLSDAESAMCSLREELAAWKERSRHCRDDVGVMQHLVWDTRMQRGYDERGMEEDVPWSNAKKDAANIDHDDGLTGHVNYWRKRATDEVRRRLAIFNQFIAVTIGLPDFWIDADALINGLDLWSKSWQSLDRSHGDDPDDWNKFLCFETPALARKRKRTAECAKGIVNSTASAYNEETKRMLHAITEYLDRQIHEINTRLILVQKQKILETEERIKLREGDQNDILEDIRDFEDRIHQLQKMQQDLRRFLRPHLNRKMRHYDHKMKIAKNTENICEIFAVGAIRHRLKIQRRHHLKIESAK
jgi:hypothetical protein